MVLKSVNFLHKSHIKNYFIERSKKVLESVLIGLTTTFNFLHILSLKLFIYYFFFQTLVLGKIQYKQQMVTEKRQVLTSRLHLFRKL